MQQRSFAAIQRKWQAYWEANRTYQTHEESGRPKYYVLDMFPYPSGAGLHVGHPLGYIASDIVARYHRHQGYEVLHPMGFDAFGLPAEQYAIETGQHPGTTTNQNIKRYREQLKMLGLSYDWSREVCTCDSSYYQWTQWIFLQFFHSWYNCHTDQAEPIETLIRAFEREGNKSINAVHDPVEPFTAEQWQAMTWQEQERVLQHYRLAYQASSEVNWCPQLGTVLANDEVQNGYSVRGGYPVEKKEMAQWFLRITAYAERLLQGLDTLNWPESIKEIQRNWIGKSQGAEVYFPLSENPAETITAFTTRPDTLYGCTFMVIAPEHPKVTALTTNAQQQEVSDFLKATQAKSERERVQEFTNVSGAFTGSYASHPLTGEQLPVYVADYVLMEYGAGAIMAVPAHDDRDHAFAKAFDLPIPKVVDNGQEDGTVHDEKTGTLTQSGPLNGLEVKDAIPKAIEELRKHEAGREKVNYRLRDACFSRQRYWGEPFPIRFKDGVPVADSEDALPINLPEVDSYQPMQDGASPLSRNQEWVQCADGSTRETQTMPGFAGSSWYFLRYMDPGNENALVSKAREQYWQDVDLYVGGAEHATGHLMYARFWQQFLYDRGHVCVKEPFRQLVNQGMIEGVSAFVYRVKDTTNNKFVSKGLKDQYDTQALHVDIHLLNSENELDIEAFRQWREEYRDAEFVLEDGRYLVGREVEKMSKSKYNVVNPDEMIDTYGCDAFRMYEMFLGPVEHSKPWSTDGIEGVYRFLKKFWNRFFDSEGHLAVTEEAPSEAELKTLHKTLKQVQEDLERFSLNTCVSQFMIATNELHKLDTRKRTILEPLVILLEPFAPHIAEELWEALGHQESISQTPLPAYEERWLQEDRHEYPVSVNGKVRVKKEFPLDKPQNELEAEVMALPEVQKWVEGKEVKKVVYVPGKIINIVVN